MIIFNIPGLLTFMLGFGDDRRHIDIFNQNLWVIGVYIETITYLCVIALIWYCICILMYIDIYWCRLYRIEKVLVNM